MRIAEPIIGSWYRWPNGNLFEIVAIDDDEGALEVQWFDGTLDEIDLETWPSLLLEAVGAPEDWSGSVDMDPEDYTGEDEGDIPVGWHDPLEMLEQGDKGI